MSKFWNKVEKCDHKNLSPNYYNHVKCDTPYCEAFESHCLDCGTYITKCGCGFLNSISGWSSERWRSYESSKLR